MDPHKIFALVLLLQLSFSCRFSFSQGEDVLNASLDGSRCGVPRLGNDDPLGLQLANAGESRLSTRIGIHNVSLAAALTIVGGSDASFGDVCWQAKITRDGWFECGGSILGKRTILSASHCVVAFPSGVTNKVTRFKIQVGAMFGNFGSTPMGRFNRDPNECAQEFNVVEIISNPKFNSRSNENDMSLLILDRDIDFSKPCVCRVCLKPKVPKIGEICAVSGYGLEKEGSVLRNPVPLKSVHINILRTEHSEHCWILGQPDLNNLICAGDRLGEDSCQGDSGGPLVCFDSETRSHYQAGVVSYGQGCGTKGTGGTYTRVSRYLDWIQKNAVGDEVNISGD